MTGVAVGVDVFACLVTLLAESSATSEVEALFMTAGPVLFGAGFDFNFWILVGLHFGGFAEETMNPLIKTV